ncbi:glycoside hydrolase family 76 protein [Stieleria sp. JC731]|uniref:glycoside hydrolase family 76 protein n=1 Tax=Pirellulaceae TaxID=2691357 RepID=UPI001E2CF400|nr:glycoside hydrolase family 76 protein [Stieleria sp. JC731]MCC9602598.1 glycoside hydrolase family 76 protein [Stieleria sp. JC731]
MTKKITCLAFLLICIQPFVPAFAQDSDSNKNEFYKQEMKSLQAAIQKHFVDQTSGNYLLVVDPNKRERKDGYLREYTYIWSLCAMFQAVNEIEKVDPKSKLVDAMIESMDPYWDPAPPVAGYSDYLMALKPGERYYDDNQWIGITALDAYERTGKESYLSLGKSMYDFMMGGYDDVLGGGIYWKDISKETKNACSNGPGVLVALQMYLATKDEKYLDSALKIYDWTNKTLQTPSKLYYDNISPKDGSINKAIFSYNTGTMLQSNLYLYEITGEAKYLNEANAIAESSLEYFYGRDRFRDDYWFNAVLLRAYQHLLKHNSDLKYVRAFKRCLDNTLRRHKTEQGLFARRGEVRSLVEHGGMLEILARFAWLEDHVDLASE